MTRSDDETVNIARGAEGVVENAKRRRAWVQKVIAAKDLAFLRAWRMYRALRLHKVSHPLIEAVPPLQRIVERGKKHLALLNRRRFVPSGALTTFYQRSLLHLLQQRKGRLLGDYLEFGVYNGTSLTCMFRALEALRLPEVRLFGFDSFEGQPADEEGHWGPGGRFSCDMPTTRRVLARENVDLSRVTLIKGFYNESLTDAVIKQHAIEKASVIMVDCDLYRSAVDCLAFSDRLIQDEAIVCFDDWHGLAERNMGEKRAFDEFLADRPQLVATRFGTYVENAEAFSVMRLTALAGTLGQVSVQVYSLV